jgi:hypothetical protein
MVVLKHCRHGGYSTDFLSVRGLLHECCKRLSYDAATAPIVNTINEDGAMGSPDVYSSDS